MTISVDKLTAKFIELRDRKAAIEKKADEEKAAIQRLMDGISDKLKELMHEQGTTSLKTPNGTAYLAHKDSATVADWDALLGYIQEHERWDLLERRVSKATVKEIMNENRKGEYENPPPPGVNFVRFETVNIRRS